MRVAHNITELVGRTPLVQLNSIPQSEGCVGKIRGDESRRFS